MTAAVVIGRNEGARLVRCLASLEGVAHPVIYVDSGSSDDSIHVARAAGAKVIELDMSAPFTAARARNAGFEALRDTSPEYVQTVDGDCEVSPGWIRVATKFMAGHEEVVAVAGRLREREADTTLWARLAEAEWNVPSGEATAVGGIALWRFAPVIEAGGFRADLIAGEEPELCFRLKRAGWRIWRLPDEMGWHDIAMTHLSQWWRRMKRNGHAVAEGAALHGRSPERYRVRETMRILAWGAGVPLIAGVGTLIATPWALLLLLSWPLQIARLSRSMGFERAFFLTFAKLPEAAGVLSFLLRRIRGRRQALIEYK